MSLQPRSRHLSDIVCLKDREERHLYEKGQMGDKRGISW